MNKLKLLVVVFLFSVCITAVAVGCGSSSGTVIGKLPVDSNMPIPNGGHDTSENKPETPPSIAEDTENPPEQTPEPPSETPAETVENVIIFIAENFEYSLPYSLNDTYVEEPSVPEKYGYSGLWQSYDLSLGGIITVTAEYELINYSVTFIADEARIEIFYTVFDSLIEAPEMLQKTGYYAEWEFFELNYGEPLTVNAVYSLIFYKIYFDVDGGLTERVYTVLDKNINEPQIPHKTGYNGEWRYGELTFGEDMFAEAVYTPLTPTADSSFKWKLLGTADGYAITEYIGTDSEVVIPPEHNGLPVTEISVNAFSEYYKGLYSVIISENIRKIGNYAFAYCTELTSVELPSTLLEIGANAFSYAGISQISLPKNLVKIDRQAFSFTNLTSIIIPDSVTELGEYAFKNCTLLKSAVIGSGLKSIPEQAFLNCSALETVEIGVNVEEICTSAFKNCTSLANAVFRDTESWLARTAVCDTYFSDGQMCDAVWIAQLLVSSENTVFIKV